MSATLTRALVALTLLFLLSSTHESVEAETVPDLTVRKAKLRFRAGNRPRDGLKLDLSFRSELLPAGFDALAEPVVVTVGQATVINLPAQDPRAAFRSKDPWRYLYREKRSRERAGVRKLRLDLAAGRLRLRAKRLDLSALRDAGAEAVEVTLRLGDREFTGSVDLAARGRSWKYKAPRPGVAVNPPPGGDGPSGGDGSLSFRILKAGLGVPRNVAPSRTGVYRSASEMAYDWGIRQPPPPPYPGHPVIQPPYVDFSREIVVLVDLGTRPTSGYEVTIVGVERVGTGARVTWEETKPGPGCAVTSWTTYPYVFAAIPRVEGTVTFTGRVRTKSCP